MPAEYEMFAWQSFDTADDRWGTIAALVPGLWAAPAPLIVRDRETAANLRPIALAHGRRIGQRVRLARFALMETIEEIG